MEKVSVVQAKDEEQIPAQVIAQSIVKIAEGWDKINRSGLNMKAVLLLISHSSRVPQRHVKAVLYALDSLKKDYLATPKKQ